MKFLAIISVLLLAIIGFFMNNYLNPDIVKINALSIRHLKGTDVLDPSFVRFTTEYSLIENLTARLFEIALDGQYVFQLAEKVTFENDKKDVYIKIRDAYFSDGSPITAEDVVKTFKRVILLGAPHSEPRKFIRGAETLKNIDDEIEGLKAISPNEIFIGLKYKMKELFYYLQMADYGILHKSQYVKQKLYLSDWQKVTSGAYSMGLTANLVQLLANNKTINSNEGMPKRVDLITLPEDKVVSAIRDGVLHVGEIKPQTLKETDLADWLPEKFSLIGGETDVIMFLTLNVKNKKFSNPVVRRWIQKKISENYTVDPMEQRIYKKAYQYFVPRSRGYISDHRIKQLMERMPNGTPPSELSDGIKVRSYTTLKEVLPSNLAENISKALGVKVQIAFDVDPNDTIYFTKKRPFEGFITANSMSYKVPGEALNFAYTSKNPIFLDIENKVKPLIKEYHSTDNVTDETNLISRIIETIIDDSECIPLNYIAYPFFFNTEVLDISNAQIDESLQFWRLRMKN